MYAWIDIYLPSGSWSVNITVTPSLNRSRGLGMDDLADEDTDMPRETNHRTGCIIPAAGVGPTGTGDQTQWITVTTRWQMKILMTRLKNAKEWREEGAALAIRAHLPID